MTALTMVSCLAVTLQRSLLVYLASAHLHNAVN